MKECQPISHSEELYSQYWTNAFRGMARDKWGDFIDTQEMVEIARSRLVEKILKQQQAGNAKPYTCALIRKMFKDAAVDALRIEFGFGNPRPSAPFLRPPNTKDRQWTEQELAEYRDLAKQVHKKICLQRLSRQETLDLLMIEVSAGRANWSQADIERCIERLYANNECGNVRGFDSLTLVDDSDDGGDEYHRRLTDDSLSAANASGIRGAHDSVEANLGDLEAKGRKQAVLDALRLLLLPNSEPQESDQERLGSTWDCLKKDPPKLTGEQTFILRTAYLEGWTKIRIAKLLGLEEHQVRYQLKKIKNLKGWLKRCGIDTGFLD